MKIQRGLTTPTQLVPGHRLHFLPSVLDCASCSQRNQNLFCFCFLFFLPRYYSLKGHREFCPFVAPGEFSDAEEKPSAVLKDKYCFSPHRRDVEEKLTKDRLSVCLFAPSFISMCFPSFWLWLCLLLLSAPQNLPIAREPAFTFPGAFSSSLQSAPSLIPPAHSATHHTVNSSNTARFSDCFMSFILPVYWQIAIQIISFRDCLSWMLSLYFFSQYPAQC